MEGPSCKVPGNAVPVQVVPVGSRGWASLLLMTDPFQGPERP